MIAQVSVDAESRVILVQDPSQIELATYGIQGPRGNAFLSGNGIPPASEGINLDLYVDLDTGFLYKKFAGAWSYQTYITPQQKKITISAQNVADKFITVSPVPKVPGSVTLEFLSGGGQENGVEFEVIGGNISWDGMALDGFIESGDIIIVRY
jgi:hypothetical protein